MTTRYYFLLATLLTLPFALRKTFWSEQAPFFKEYSDISLYGFEIFLLGYIAISILEHRKEIKSIIQKLFHVEHLLLFVLFAIPTILAAFYEHRYYGIYFFARWSTYLLFAFLLYHDLKSIVPRGTIDLNAPLKCSTWNILRGAFFLALLTQAIVIIGQISVQHSLGLTYMGEQILNPSINGVSTIIVNGQELLRGYGTFLHPNIAAFFFFTYGISLYLLSIVPRGTFPLSQNGTNCSTWNIPLITKWHKLFHVEHSPYHKMAQIVPRGTIFVLLGVILIGFLLTFSKSVIIISIFSLLLFIYIVNCSTWNNYFRNFTSMFHVEHTSSAKKSSIVPRGTIFTLIFILIVLIISLSQTLIPDFVHQSILERKLQYLSIPVSYPAELLVGQGLGSYVEVLGEKSPGLFSWQLQPIHNTYVLWVFDLGLLPLLGITVYLWQKRKKYFQNWIYTPFSHVQKMVLIVAGGTALLLAVDHYTWDLEQGQFLFILLITLLIFSYQRGISKTIK